MKANTSFSDYFHSCCIFIFMMLHGAGIAQPSVTSLEAKRYRFLVLAEAKAFLQMLQTCFGTDSISYTAGTKIIFQQIGNEVTC
jgi:hypothetical protein